MISYKHFLFVLFPWLILQGTIFAKQSKEDTFASQFCSNIGDAKKVVLEDSTLKIYSTPGKLKTALSSFITAILATAIACTPFDKQYGGDTGQRVGFMVTLAILGIYPAKVAYKQLKYHLLSSPTFMLSRTGITIEQEKEVSWKNILKIELDSFHKSLKIYNTFGKELADIADGDIRLPISTNELYVIVNHYWNMYKS